MAMGRFGGLRQRAARYRDGAWLGATILAASLASPGVAGAQPGRFHVEGLDEATEEGPLSIEDPNPSLAERLGVERSEDLLLEGNAAARLRGLERLGGAEQDEALEMLAEAMSPGRAVRNDPEARLVGVRMLAPHAAEDEDARKTLAGVLNDVRAGSPESPLDQLARATAAMALAAAGTDETLTPLITAVIGGGRTGAIARQALLAHRPPSLGPFSKSLDDMSPRTIALLGDLGDPRAFGLLRKQLKRDDHEAKRAAAIALAKLGDGSAVAQAQRWLREKGDDHVDDRVAAAEVLVRLDAPGAAQAVAGLLGRAKSRRAGLRLAELSSSPALVPTLGAVIAADVTPPERARATSLLARMGTDEAVQALVPLLAKPELATVAALGLARSPGALARAALARALVDSEAGAPRRLAMRAAVVRYLGLGETVPGLVSALRAAKASEDDADRAVAAFGLVVMAKEDPVAASRSDDPVVRAAARRAAIVFGPTTLANLRPQLAALAHAPAEGKASAADLVSASLALIADPGEERYGVPTSQLARWAERGGLTSPLAAYRLAVRDSAPYRGRLRSLLEGTDPLVRLHVALGLARSPEPDATALLVEAYRFEADPEVRGAVVRALSWRPERLGEATLELAERLDPDARVRALARSARRGRKHVLVGLPAGRQVAWITLRPNGQSARVPHRPALLVRGDGVALPVVSAPDGVLVVPGMSASQRLNLRLAELP